VNKKEQLHQYEKEKDQHFLFIEKIELWIKVYTCKQNILSSVLSYALCFIYTSSFSLARSKLRKDLSMPNDERTLVAVKRHAASHHVKPLEHHAKVFFFVARSMPQF